MPILLEISHIPLKMKAINVINGIRRRLNSVPIKFWLKTLGKDRRTKGLWAELYIDREKDLNQFLDLVDYHLEHLNKLVPISIKIINERYAHQAKDHDREVNRKKRLEDDKKRRSENPEKYIFRKVDRILRRKKEMPEFKKFKEVLIKEMYHEPIKKHFSFSHYKWCMRLLHNVLNTRLCLLLTENGYSLSRRVKITEKKVLTLYQYKHGFGKESELVKTIKRQVIEAELPIFNRFQKKEEVIKKRHRSRKITEWVVKDEC